MANIKMRYSMRYRIYVKGYGFLSFAENMSKKDSQKLLNSAKKSTTDAIKIASKRAIQKIAEATGDLIGNKTEDKITSISKSPKEFHSKELHSKADENEIEIPKKIYIYIRKNDKLLMN